MSEPLAAPRRRRRLFITLAVLFALTLILWLTVTSSAPNVPQRAAPSAQDVAAGRAAYWQLREARGNKAGKRVSLGAAELAGLGAVASHGFRPDRLQLATKDRDFRVSGSHRLPLGRWLNVTVIAEGPSKGFPVSRLEIGIWSLSPTVTRWVLELGRLYVKRRTEVLPLDQLVRDFSIRGGSVSALVSLPGKMGLVEQMAGAVSEQVNREQVARIYCALSERQRKQPSGDFAEHVRRAFSILPGSASRADFNRAAFVALAMMLVDERAGDFAQIEPGDIGRCRTAIVPASIYGRFDWSKHWALSAAISVGAGMQLSEAVGEWKELADSVERGSRFSIGDPTGFSMADLAADRAGFRIAQVAVQPENAERLARRLAHVSPEQLLPRQLVSKDESLTNAEFVARYGRIDDPRFRARAREIDRVLDMSWLR